MRQIAVMTAILLTVASTPMSSAACNMNLIARHADPSRTRIYAASGECLYLLQDRYGREHR